MRISSVLGTYAWGVQEAIATQDLEIRYGDVVALTALTMSVPLGVSLAVVGGNGSGKSTLLGALAGVFKPTKGTVSVIEARPSFVLQATEVDAALPITSRDAVALARYPSLGLFGRFTQADQDAVARAVERMHVTDFVNVSLHQLSGGQRQRVLLAQGLAQESRILLLDEPMTGLDVTSRQNVLDVIAQEVAADRTVVMATHSLTDARACDLVLLLDTAPVAFGPPDEVLVESNLKDTFGHRVVYVGDDLVLDAHHAH